MKKNLNKILLILFILISMVFCVYSLSIYKIILCSEIFEIIILFFIVYLFLIIIFINNKYWLKSIVVYLFILYLILFLFLLFILLFNMNSLQTEVFQIVGYIQVERIWKTEELLKIALNLRLNLSKTDINLNEIIKIHNTPEKLNDYFKFLKEREDESFLWSACRYFWELPILYKLGLGVSVVITFSSIFYLIKSGFDVKQIYADIYNLFVSPFQLKDLSISTNINPSDALEVDSVSEVQDAILSKNSLSDTDEITIVNESDVVPKLADEVFPSYFNYAIQPGSSSKYTDYSPSDSPRSSSPERDIPIHTSSVSIAEYLANSEANNLLSIQAQNDLAYQILGSIAKQECIKRTGEIISANDVMSNGANIYNSNILASALYEHCTKSINPTLLQRCIIESYQFSIDSPTSLPLSEEKAVIFSKFLNLITKKLHSEIDLNFLITNLNLIGNSEEEKVLKNFLLRSYSNFSEYAFFL